MFLFVTVWRMTHAVCAIGYLTISKWKQLAGVDLCTQYSFQDNLLPRSSFSLLARSSFSKVSAWFQYSFSSRFAIHFVLLVCFHLCAHSEEYSYMLGTKQNYTMNFCRLIWVGPSSAANFSSARGRKENQGRVSWLEDILLYNNLLQIAFIGICTLVSSYQELRNLSWLIYYRKLSELTSRN